ncbi:MAG TPA: YncE family protein [Acidobacteriaceae bacterium]|nr:YncE family protein [Acidobacteriaceae bacterium]
MPYSARPHTARLLALGCLFALCSSLIFAPAARAQGPYHLSVQWKVGGDSWWDYMAVDPVSHLLYVTHGDQVVVIKPSGKVLDRMTGFKGLHGVAFDASGKYGFLSDGGTNEVVVFNRKTRAIVAHIPAGQNPDGLTFDPYSHTAWAFNGRSNTATVVSARTLKVVATIALPGRPEFPVADGRGYVYDNIESLSKIVKINSTTHQIVAAWPLAPCESPSGLAIDVAHHRLFSVCHNKLMAIVDTDSGKVVATVPIDQGPDAARFDPRHQLAFSTNGQGTLTVVHEDSPDHYTVIQTLPTKRGARTMALNLATGTIYTDTADFGPAPKPTPGQHWHRPSLIPGSFTVLEIKR